MWWQMRMSDRDISDVTGYTYTFLTNGMTPDDNWTGIFSRGERVLLRFVNAAAMTNFDVRIPGLKMTVVAADGQYVEPVSVDEFRIGVAETYDVIVEPVEGAYTCLRRLSTGRVMHAALCRKRQGWRRRFRHWIRRLFLVMPTWGWI